MVFLFVLITFDPILDDFLRFWINPEIQDGGPRWPPFRNGLDCLIKADFYGLFRFRLLVHTAYCYFSSELVFLVAFILAFRGTKTRASRLFRPFSLYF